MRFKAVMMDFDGTVTKKGSVFPSGKMIDKLISVAEKTPIAFCTGRQLESFEKRGLNAILKRIPEDKKIQILSNIFLIGENGSIGYFFNKKTKKFKEFYRAAWPDKFIKKDYLTKLLRDEISKYGEIINVHRVVVVMRAHRVNETPIKDVYFKSHKMFSICQKELSKYNKNYEEFLHLGDSGIGVIVCPADGDKDTGIKKFAEFLKKTRNMKFTKNLKNILIIGDSAQRDGNDYYFLKGIYGTPFTVGYFDPKAKSPIPVLNKSNKRLLHENGTKYLLDHCF
jgi:hydroxymethylpyrimidine pyrophosphatase-like HAD family hydrolase